MKLIIAGSRNLGNYARTRRAIIDSGLWTTHKHNLEIVTGMAQGPDLDGWKFGKKNKLVVHEFRPDWDKHGKKAGILRNIEMGEFADALIAIWDGKSRGTAQMINWAKANGLFVYVHIVEDSE